MGRAEKIATERIDYLYALAKEKIVERPEDSRRYVQMLRDLATKHNLSITDKKRTFCKKCNTLLVPGKTSSVRVQKDRRIFTCLYCKTVKRLGLNGKP